MHTIDRVEDGGQCVLRVSGEVLLDGARELFERVAQEDCDRVVLDFTACHVEDRALSALADLLGQGQLRLAVRGLRDRQLRLLEYLGATPAAP
jgi:c-di-GMP-related signal transduction protein